MTLPQPSRISVSDDESETITISYRGRGSSMSASLIMDNGLDADAAYDWLLRAITAIGFSELTKLIEGKQP